MLHRVSHGPYLLDPAGDGRGGSLAEAASALAGADIALAYSTAFPSADGLRLPELSAALSAVMRPDSLVITTDKWLVGRRFEFVDMVIIEGEEGPEDVIRAFIWKLKGEVPVRLAQGGEAGEGGLKVVKQELEEIMRDWMDDEDACSQNPDACAAMLTSLENEFNIIQELNEAEVSDVEVIG